MCACLTGGVRLYWVLHVALVVALNISSHNGVLKVPLPLVIPVENQGLNQKGPIHHRTIALPATDLKTMQRRRRRDLQMTPHGNLDQLEVHMIPHMMPPLMILQRGAKEILKTVVLLQVGDLHRLRDQSPPRCPVHVRGSVPNLQRSRKLN